MLYAGFHELTEQRMCSVRSALELRMILYSYKEPVVRILHCFHQVHIRIDAGKTHSVQFKLFPLCIVEFIAVTVTFGDHVCLIACFKQAARSDCAWIST